LTRRPFGQHAGPGRNVPKALARVEQARDDLVQLTERSNDFVAMADLDERFTYMNSAGKRMIGLDREGDPRDLHFSDALAQWFRARTENARGTRKTMIVALARKLLMALWRLVREGVVPDGIVLRPAQ
jgi:PAS domain-containing protein